VGGIEGKSEEEIFASVVGTTQSNFRGALQIPKIGIGGRVMAGLREFAKSFFVLFFLGEFEALVDVSLQLGFEVDGRSGGSVVDL